MFWWKLQTRELCLSGSELACELLTSETPQMSRELRDRGREGEGEKERGRERQREGERERGREGGREHTPLHSTH